MEPTHQLPPISSIPHLPTASHVAILDSLFEPSEALCELSVGLLAERTFGSYDELVAAVGALLEGLLESESARDTEELDRVLSAHPRLGEKKVESALSRGEQAGLKQGSGEEGEELRALNEDYERGFPGMSLAGENPFPAGPTVAS
jgi:2-oxo-4-hydroxy-4-carboxy--5-ureidoimidazoline (OHCU) decarboxylase